MRFLGIYDIALSRSLGVCLIEGLTASAGGVDLELVLLKSSLAFALLFLRYVYLYTGAMPLSRS